MSPDGVELSGLGSIGRDLCSDLGPALTAFCVNHSEETVIAWADGHSEPPEDAGPALRATYRAFSIVSGADSAAVARAWFMGMNPSLADSSPAEALRDGHHTDVLAAARSHVQTS